MNHFSCVSHHKESCLYSHEDQTGWGGMSQRGKHAVLFLMAEIIFKLMPDSPIHSPWYTLCSVCLFSWPALLPGSSTSLAYCSDQDVWIWGLTLLWFIGRGGGGVRSKNTSRDILTLRDTNRNLVRVNFDCDGASGSYYAADLKTVK